MLGLREIEATQETIRELRQSGQGDRADAVAAVLEAAVTAVTARAPAGDRPFLTTGDAARALGVSIQTVKNWAAAGRLPLIRLGGRNVIRREDLLAYVEAMGKPPVGDGPFDGPGVDDERVRAALPDHVVARIDAYHEAIERGEPLSASERAELRRLEETATRLAGTHVARSTR